jgi:hypothetical protein
VSADLIMYGTILVGAMTGIYLIVRGLNAGSGD